MTDLARPPLFRIDQHQRADGTTQLALIGELDLAYAEQLARHLGELSAAHHRVILSLAGLTFIDSSGIRVIVNAAIDARRDGWDLEISQELPPQVRRVIDLTGLTTFLWPAATHAHLLQESRSTRTPDSPPPLGL